MVWQVLAIATDVLHALLMATWFAGLPLLVWHRWPRAARLYAIYAIVFVIVSRVSQWILGECFLTAAAIYFWDHVPASAPVSKDWFTVRLAQAVFHLSPSHRTIALVSEGMIIVAAAVALSWLHRLDIRRRAAHDAPSPPS
jgi:hypothetical protein